MPELPQGYFIFPVKPGQQNFIAGSMGELRSNHFHGGLDIKTDGVINHPIYASADGYVCRIKVSSTGYGNVLYVRHPNNFVTVYAHLEKFSKPIADYVRKKQYEKETFDIELLPGPDELLVKQKDVIALSGNSGSSGGPHLHYEIRDTLDNTFNPLRFGFTELKDNIDPVLHRIALRPIGINSRVNNEFDRAEYNLIRSGSIYTITQNITAFGTFGIELKAFDKMNGTANTYGLERIEVIVDQDTVFSHNISYHPIEQSRCINHHIDYCTFVNKGQRFEKCYVANGNTLPIYKTLENGGKITIKDGQTYKVKINAYDGFDNKSTLEFKVKGQNPQTSLKGASPATSSYESEIFENILKIVHKNPSDEQFTLFLKNKKTLELQPSYRKSGFNIYLYDFKDGLPDSLSIGNTGENLHFVSAVIPGKETVIEKDNIKIEIPSDAVFDTLFLKIHSELKPDGEEYFHVHDLLTPLYRPVQITIDPKKIYDRSNTRLYSINKYNRASFEGGKWNENKITLKTKNFGTFTLDQDTIPPNVSLKSVQGNTIYLNISDNKTGIESFRATLNGEWILMNYDHKRNLSWSDRLEKSTLLKGDFVIEVKDGSGNIRIFKTKL